MVSLLDHNIGILLNTLKKLGLSDNTRIIYTSDHGELLEIMECGAKCAFMKNQ